MRGNWVVELTFQTATRAHITAIKDGEQTYVAGRANPGQSTRTAGHVEKFYLDAAFEDPVVRVEVTVRCGGDTIETADLATSHGDEFVYVACRIDRDGNPDAELGIDDDYAGYPWEGAK